MEIYLDKKAIIQCTYAEKREINCNKKCKHCVEVTTDESAKGNFQ